MLDPVRDAARVSAMYTHPEFTRRGVGRLILELCESAAAAEGFVRLELMATLSGQPLYAAAGFEAVEKFVDSTSDRTIPLVRMSKSIASSAHRDDPGHARPPGGGSLRRRDIA